MPRYQKFTAAAQELLQAGTKFAEIAGNRQIMVTAVIPRDQIVPPQLGDTLFSMELLTNPGLKRIAIRVPVASLNSLCAALPIEHIYDY